MNSQTLIVEKSNTLPILTNLIETMSAVVKGYQGKLPDPSNQGAYVKFVNSIPYLTEEQEYELGLKMQQYKCMLSAQMLVLSHLRAVVPIALEYKGYGLPFEDLVQQGNVGLMKAVRGFDVSRGARLISYAISWIKSEIQEFVQNNFKLVKLGAGKVAKKLFYNVRKNEHLSDDELAGKLNVSTEDIQAAKGYFAGTYTDVEDAYNLIGAESPELCLEHKQNEQRNTRIKKAVLELSDRERLIVESRFLTENPLTFKDLAKQMGISAERVRQLEQSALQKLKMKIT